jgi:hypothetical protein
VLCGGNAGPVPFRFNWLGIAWTRRGAFWDDLHQRIVLITSPCKHFFLVGSILCCASIDYACLQLLVFMRLGLNFSLLLILHLYHDTCWSWSCALFLLCALLHDRTEAMQTPFVIGPHGGVQTLSLTFDAKMAPFIINFVLLNPASSSHREESWIRCVSFSESTSETQDVEGLQFRV